MDTEPTLTLTADSLCSKWGFNDGDLPDYLMDHWDAFEPTLDQGSVNWHGVLRTLVRIHLVPAIESAGHTVEVYDIETIHNPIRAAVLDGVAVDDYDGNESGIDVSVTVSYAEIMRTIEAES